MSLAYTLFRLHRLDSGRHAGWAIVCPEARYASLALVGVAALVRRHVSLSQWRQIEHEAHMGFNSGPLPAGSVHATVLAGEFSRSVVIQYVTVRTLTCEPMAVTSELDAALLSSGDDW